MKWRKLEKEKMNKFYMGIIVGSFLVTIALILFKEISFVIGGVGIMVIGFSLLYYLIEMTKSL